MASQKRDYKSEYRRRIERGLAKGLSRSQARGHPKAKERPKDQRLVKTDQGLTAAVLDMNRGTSMTAAARDNHVSVERLRRYVTQEGIGKKKGRRWRLTDSRPRRLPVITRGTIKTLTVPGYPEARLAGAHYAAVGQFVRTNDLGHLLPFRGQTIRTTAGTKYRLETDPNTLHRIAAMDMPVFHEIYEIVSAT